MPVITIRLRPSAGAAARTTTARTASSQNGYHEVVLGGGCVLCEYRRRVQL